VTEEYIDFTQHKFGAGTLRELATKLYRSPIAGFIMIQGKASIIGKELEQNET